MIKINKKFIVLLIVCSLVFGLAACATNEPAKKVSMNIATLKGPTGMGMAKLMDQNKKEETKVDYDFTVLGAPDEMVGKIINGDVDVAAVPTNMASILYNKTKGEVKLAAVNTLGVLYILENGEEIKSVEDLKGKKIHASGKGATPDYILQYILKENGLEIGKDVEVDFTMQHAELAAATAAGDVNIALLPQPHVTTAMMKNDDLKIALNMTEEWDKITGDKGKLAMGAIVVRKKFIEDNKEAFDKFLDEYKYSVDWVNENNEEASKLIEGAGILPKAVIAKKALPYCNIVYIDAKESKGFLNDYYKILFEFNPKSVGGKLPDEPFYYER